MMEVKLPTEGTTSLAQSAPTTHDPDAKRKIVNRLRRAHEQLAAVIEAVESDAHCRDSVHQLSAVSKALDRAGFLMISSALKECMTAPDGQADVEELEKLFLSLA